MLLYGPDGGLVRERVKAMLTHIAGDAADPFRVAEIEASQLRDDPARLADEAASLSLTGGRRAVRVRESGNGETLAPLLESYLNTLPPGSPQSVILIEAGELGPRLKLRRLCEDAESAAAIACYGDEGADLGRLIETVCGKAGVTVSDGARHALLAHLGADRQISRSELEKLCLYAGEGGQVNEADVAACVGDSAAFALDDIALATGEGDCAALVRALDRAFGEGVNAVAVLRATARHFQRLHLARGHLDAGRDPRGALGALRPPVFYKQEPALRRQITAWDRAGLERALAHLLTLERRVKSTGMPAETVCREGLLAICVSGRRRTAGRGRAA